MHPPDAHVHSEWSWDAFSGSMEQTCARAVELRLPWLAFTEHADFTPWRTDDGVFTPPELDVDGYLDCLERCRARFPSLRILSGIELGDPHRHRERADELLERGRFERVLGALHSAPAPDGGWRDALIAHRDRQPADVVREYLAEATRMIEAFDRFDALAHIDYPVRTWPAEAGPYDPRAFEDDYRPVLRALARAGKALEVNTRVPLAPEVVRWWREEDGEAISFGSDAHEPSELARGLADAAAMVEAAGFSVGP